MHTLPDTYRVHLQSLLSFKCFSNDVNLNEKSSYFKIFQIISHPNLARFYGFCYDETKEYVMLTSELMDLKSLADFLKVSCTSAISLLSHLWLCCWIFSMLLDKISVILRFCCGDKLLKSKINSFCT